MVDPCLSAEQLLLPRLIGQVPSHLVAVLFRLQRRDQVYPRPHLLAREFAVHYRQHCFTTPLQRPCCELARSFAHAPAIYACHILVLPDSLSYPPETVGHECGRAEQVHGGSEAAHGEVALVLDGVVPAHGGHILRHCGRSLCSCGGSMGGFGGIAVVSWCGDVRFAMTMPRKGPVALVMRA